MNLDALRGRAFTPDEFFDDVLPALHKRRGYDDFDMYAEVPIPVLFVLTRPGGPPRKWGVRFWIDALQVTKGGIDDPLLQIHVPEDDFTLMSTRLVEFVLRIEDYLDGPGVFVAEEHLPMLRAIRGGVCIKLERYPDGKKTRDVISEIWLTDRNTRPTRTFNVRISARNFEKLASGKLDVVGAVGDGHVVVEGDMALAMKVGAAIGRLK